jgi:phosphatidate cytidylyltransferase
VATETTLAGVIYVAFPASLSSPFAPSSRIRGLTWLILVFAVTWGADSFAYLGGRYFGRTKLAPALSPKKTVEGAVVGVIGGIVPAALILMVTGKLSAGTLVLIGLGPLAIAGDLFGSVSASSRSGFARRRSEHLSGHGGVLDRVDSLLWVTTLFYGFLALGGVIG